MRRLNPMKPILMVAFIFSLCGTLALSARLVKAGLRTRTTPELVYGSALVLTGIGSIVRLIVFGFVGISDDTRAAVVFASLFSIATLFVVTTGIRIIFRPMSRWPFAIQAILMAVAACGTWNIATAPIDAGVRPLPQMLNDVANSGMMAWGAVESISYWSKLRRRRLLGIAGPVVTEQFKLWGLGFCLGLCASASLWLTPLVLGRLMLEVPLIMLGVNLSLVAMTLSLWMAFYPPTAYRKRIESRYTGA